jgi:hypothetical protein
MVMKRREVSDEIVVHRSPPALGTITSIGKYLGLREILPDPSFHFLPLSASGDGVRG